MRKLKLFLDAKAANTPPRGISKASRVIFSVLTLLLLSVGNVWAETAAVGTTLFSEDFSGYAKDAVPNGSVSAGTGRAIYGNGSVTYSVTNGGGTTKIYTENLAGGTSPEILVGKSNGTLVIEGIPAGGAQEITVSYKQNKQKLKVEASGTGYSGSKEEKPSASQSYSFDVTVADGAAETFTLTFTCNGSSNVRVDDILVTVKTAGEGSTPPTPAKTLVSVAVSGTPTKTSYYAGQDFDPAGLTVTGTYSDESTAPITSGITWSYDPSQELALNQTSIGVIATVSEIASPKFNVTGLSVTEAPAAVNYEKVDAEPADWSGEYILVYEADETNARVWKGADAANNYAEATISAGVIAAPEGAAVLTIAKVAESSPVVYTIKVGEKYIGQTSDANGMKIQDDAINNSISYNTTDAAVDIVASSAHLRYNSASSSYFRYYKSATYSGQKKIQLYKKVDGTVKEAAGLAYAEADKKKLAKLGDAFTAPTLSNENGLTVTYASSNTEVAEVATDGAVTIKAAGKAEITASSEETETFKAGSAKYTIYVAEKAGTAEDPLTVASAKSLIDLGCEMEVHVHGTVLGSQDATKFTVTLADGFQFYKLKDLGNVAFESAYIKNGDEVTAVGTLTKYNTTYELAEGCYLTAYTEYTEPLVDISNTKETAYTVAQALALATNPTSDLTKAVYITGVVYDVKSFNSTNGTLDIYIKDEGVENKFEFYKCAGIYDESLTAFTAADDVQVGDEVIGYGVMKYFSGGSIWEFDNTATGDYLVELTRPEVAVTSVAMTESTAEVEVGSTVTLHASVLPENATNKAITWSVQSGSDYASVDAGVVTGNAEGEAVIRAASTADPTKYAECTVTVNAADPTKHVVTFDATVDKTTEATELSITKGDLTIAVTEGDGRFNNGTDYRPYKNSVFTVSCSNGNITKIEFTCTSSKPITGFADLEGLDKANEVWTGNSASVSFTASGAQVQMTQLVITYKEDNRDEAGLAWDPSDDIELTVGDAFTAPTLLNPNSIDAEEITIASDNTELATVNAGVVELVAEATGEATITATFAGNEDYKPAVVSYIITVNAAAPVVLTDYYEKVTETAGIVEGTYLIVYEDGENSLAFNGGLETLDAESNTIAVTITNDNKIGVTTETAAATFYIDPAAGTVKSASDHYIGVSSWSNGLKQTDTYVHNVLEIDGDGNAQVGIYNADWNTTGGTMRLQYNKSAGQTRFRYYKNGGQQPIALYKLANETVKPAAGLAWDPAEDITLTVGDAFTAPTLLNPNSIDAAEITIASSNPAVATVTAGVVELVEDATGTTTITATFAGNASYKPATVSYKIKVNPAHSIYVSPGLTVNFGSVAKDATVEDKVITVTLTEVPNATATLGGDNPEVFSIDPASPAALTASGDITISASSATVGTFEAKLTISDDASLATSRVVTLKLTVTDPAAEETPISTSTQWVAATAADLVDGAEVIITGVKDEVVYAMGEQKSTNRAAYVASVDGDGVLTPGEGTMSFTLVAQEAEGVFALRTSDGKYLYAAASGSNHLKTQDNVDVNAQWTLAVNSAVATGSSNRNVMQFNGSGTNKLFSCYASDSQEDIQFYVPKPATPEPQPEIIRDGLEAGKWGTICPTQNISEVEGATFYQIAYLEELGGVPYNMVFDEIEGTTLTAGKPYFFIAIASEIRGIKAGAVLDAADPDGVNGFYGYIGAAPMHLSYLADYNPSSDNTFVIYDNSVFRITGATDLKSERCYIVINATLPSREANSQAPGRRRINMAVTGTNVATGIDAINASEKPMKLMIDGQIYILRGEKLFDTTGRLVK